MRNGTIYQRDIFDDRTFGSWGRINVNCSAGRADTRCEFRHCWLMIATSGAAVPWMALLLHCFGNMFRYTFFEFDVSTWCFISFIFVVLFSLNLYLYLLIIYLFMIFLFFSFFKTIYLSIHWLTRNLFTRLFWRSFSLYLNLILYIFPTISDICLYTLTGLITIQTYFQTQVGTLPRTLDWAVRYPSGRVQKRRLSRRRQFEIQINHSQYKERQSSNLASTPRVHRVPPSG